MATGQSSKKYHTTVVDKERVQKRFDVLKKDLLVLLQKLHQNKLVLNYGSKVATAKPADIVRVISEWKQKDILDLSIRNIMVNAILSSENKQIGSGIICAAVMTTDRFANDHFDIRKNRIEKDILIDSLKYQLGNGIINDIATNCLDMGAMGGSMRFHLSNKDEFLIRQISTQSIPGTIHPIFGAHPSHLESVLIIAVDGIIESLGEIDNLLQTAAKNKQNVVLCAGGFGPDVVQTLSHNWQNKNLSVFPFWVSKWGEDESCMSTCSKLDIECISPENGRSLRIFDLQSCKPVDAVYFGESGLSLKNDAGKFMHLDIRMPKRFESLIGVVEDRIRVALKNTEGLAKFGSADLHFLENISKHVGAESKIIASSISQVIGHRAAESCKKMINEMGGIILPIV